MSFKNMFGTIDNKINNGENYQVAIKNVAYQISQINKIEGCAPIYCKELDKYFILERKYIKDK